MSEIKRKFDDISEKYDGQRRKLIPCFDDFYGVSAIAAQVDRENPRILDIGAGTGLLSAFLMKRYPGASLTLMDISDKMMDIARERFGDNPNVEYVIGDYTKIDFEGKYDIIGSALSIHHLEDEEKKKLYQKSYLALSENGVFINADQVHGETPFIESLNKTIWRQAIENSGLPKEEIAQGYERIKLDREATLEKQLGWLSEMGFCDVGCVYKFYHFAVMMGRKTT